MIMNQEEAMEQLRIRLRELRKRARLTQSEMGQILGVSAQTVSGYESGVIVPGTEALLSYADYFKVDCNYLMHGIKDTLNSDVFNIRQEEKELILAFRKCPEWKQEAFLKLISDEE